MNEQCYKCAAKHECGSAVEYGSIICMVNRMHSGQSKADFIGAKKPEQLFCAYCGQPLTDNGRNKYCSNVQCPNRFEDV